MSAEVRRVADSKPDSAPPAHGDLKRYRGARVLVTGGLGFLGSNLAHRLVELDARVMLVDSLIPEYGGNLFNISGIADRVTVNIADVRDPYSMRVLVQGCEFLFNLAGQTAHLDSMQRPYDDLDINCRAQLSILESCRSNNPAIRIVFASTRQIYGRPRYLPVDETHPTVPVDVNGINKLAGESYHLLYDEVHGIHSCALRLTNTIGPRMRIRDARQTFLGAWIRALFEARPISVWGGGQRRDFTYVDDAVSALLLAGVTDEARGRAINIGGSEPVRLDALAALLCECYGGGEYRIDEFPHQNAAIEIGDYFADDALARELLHWRPETADLRAMLTSTLEYYAQHLSEYL
jgi:UDP-glucose 4-epimerase